jgi:hypothetical protein
MRKAGFTTLVVCVLFCAVGAWAQGICPLNGTTVNKMICVLPQVYGPFGLGTAPGNQGTLRTGFHEGHFGSDFVSKQGPIGEAVGTQVSQLPIASPSSALSFIYDTSLKTFVPSTEETLGPILGERAGTIGRRKIYVAFSYQHFSFSSLDGIGMKDFPVILQHEADDPQPAPACCAPCPKQNGLVGTDSSGKAYAGNPCYVRDYIQTRNNINLRANQYTFYLTYGITNRFDVSAAIPIVNVSMDVSSQAGIVQNTIAASRFVLPGNAFHQFNPAIVSGCTTSPCMAGNFTDSLSKTGIGDVLLRGKYEVLKGEKTGIALGVDVRTPTGDAENLLGSGAAGVKPFGVISYSARISPHAEIGYEWNGDSILAANFVGPQATNIKASLPNRFVYTVGADASINRRLTASFDILGERLFNSPRLVSSPFTDFGSCNTPTCAVYTPGTAHPDVNVVSSDFNETNASFGLKFRAVGKLILTGNILVALDDGGLRSHVVPLVGVSYSF